MPLHDDEPGILENLQMPGRGLPTHFKTSD
jgi:hypothetical protein